MFKSFNKFKKLQYFQELSRMDTLRKEDVRHNRERIRKNLRTCLSTGSQPNPEITIKSQKNFSSRLNSKLQRKSSDNLQYYDEASYLDHIYPCSSFQKMFELLEKVGQGSHSAVYKCRQLATDKIYAVKVFLFVEPQNVRHIKQHYRIKKVLNHQNIIKANYLFVHIQQKRMSIVREFCPYGTLRCFMNKNHKISNHKIAKIVHSLISGIDYMHKHGVCHRDIKPQNIMYNPQTEELKIIDFELAKMRKYMNEKLDMWTNTGTLHYKAPQMFKGNYDEAIDIWAVGVILYELAYHRLPFYKEYVCDTITAICDTQPDYEGVDVSPCLLYLIKKCLVKDQTKRITSTQALKTPFLLKYSEGSPNSKIKKRRSVNTDKEEDKSEKHYNLIPKQVQKASYSQDDQRSQHCSFSQDIGIRFYER